MTRPAIPNFRYDHLSLPEMAYRQLRNAILNGQLKPGEMLRQEDLAKALGVSRAPLREALPRLEAEGVVVLHPRRGYSVVSLDHDDIRQVFDLRAVIEERAVHVATSNRTAEDVQQARRICEEMALIAPDVTDFVRWFDLNFQFHDTMVAPAGRHYRRTAASLRTVVEPYIRFEITLTGDMLQAQREHEEMLLAFEAGDPQRTARLARAHIESTMQRLFKGLSADSKVA